MGVMPESIVEVELCVVKQQYGKESGQQTLKTVVSLSRRSPFHSIILSTYAVGFA